MQRLRFAKTERRLRDNRADSAVFDEADVFPNTVAVPVHLTDRDRFCELFTYVEVHDDGECGIVGQQYRRPHASTIWRWSLRGIGGVKLETAKIGSQIVTSKQAVTRFIAATSDQRN